jgi:uncharacterized protein DUF4082
VAITANTPYVVSYHAPNGFYSSSSAYFNGAVSNYPLTALASATAAHGNGVYAYGSTSTFPTNTYNSTNYWVDPTFTLSAPTNAATPAAAVPGGATATSGVTSGASSGTASGSTAAKSTTTNGLDPDDSATKPPLSNSVVGNVQPVMVRFPGAIEPQSLKIKVTTTVAALGSESPASTSITGEVVYDPKTQTAVFHPSTTLIPGATYDAVATAKDDEGVAMAPITWMFKAAATAHATKPVQRSPLGGRVTPAGSLAAEIEERSAR